MANKYLFIVVLISQIFYGQIHTDSLIFNSNYSYLSLHEYQRIIEINGESKLDGKYYIVDNKNNLSIKIYKKGFKNGEWLSFYNQSNGLKLIQVINFTDDEKNGYYFTANDTYIEKGNYKQNKKHGLWYKKSFWSENTIEITTYKNGVKNGLNRKTNFDFEETEEYVYKNGIKHGRYIYESKKYKIKTEGSYKNDLKHGFWITTDNYLNTLNDSLNVKKEYFKKGVKIQ